MGRNKSLQDTGDKLKSNVKAYKMCYISSAADDKYSYPEGESEGVEATHPPPGPAVLISIKAGVK